jgi:hypothetical protein
MAVALAVFGFAFAAFSIWLTVRVINRHERWAKWTLALAVVVPALYVASVVPAMWLARHDYLPAWMKTACGYLYQPLFLDVIPALRRFLEWFE